MSDQIAAAAIGSAISALRLKKQGWISVSQALVTGFCCSYYLADDVIIALRQNFDIILSYGAVYFLIAYFGSEILQRVLLIIKTFRVSKKWQ